MATANMGAAEEAAAKAAASQMGAKEADMQKIQEQQQKAEEQQEQKRVMIRTLLESDALERLNRVGMVKKDTQDQVEAMILQMAQRGQIQEKVSEAQITQLLEKIGEVKSNTSSVKIIRKKRDDSDSDIDLDNL